MIGLVKGRNIDSLLEKRLGRLDGKKRERAIEFLREEGIKNIAIRKD